jgi:phosphatidylglycerophosphate synthase
MTLPDLLTLLRLLSVPVLLLLAWLQLQMPYFWLLLFALGTDAVDGYLARRLRVSSPLGARLDSYADLSLFLSTLLSLVWLFPEFMAKHAWLVAGVLSSYLLADLLGYLKFRRLTSYHTRGAKLSAVLLGATVLGLFWLPRIEWLLYPAAAISIAAYLEEMAITLTLPAWRADVPSWPAARRIAGTIAGERQTGEE